MDDGSIDGTEDLVKALRDKRIIYEWNENSGGPANPRNRGIIKSNGDYIAFLDADDLWYPNKLEMATKCLISGADLVYHDMDHSYNNNIIRKKSATLKSTICVNILINGNPIINSSVVVNKNIIKLIGLQNESKSYISVEDYDYWLRISRITNSFHKIHRVLGQYKVHKGNISSGIKHINRTIMVTRLYHIFLNDIELAKSESLVNYIKGNYFSKNKKYSLALYYYIQVLKRKASIIIKLKSVYRFLLILSIFLFTKIFQHKSM